ncbi:calcium uniporter regulatory subunit MCUb, mitochondrial isoform X2 [Mastomys coucha]|uniref:calcium uniporter regulatory subunit MCUb, mitochondrial isoform X2 n=1 Tax=Mastomys coucha TaxID=35658 RepID=UPI0012619EFF|nr:calcium uniporter regulatory subunit MCUb, mitochondrial isoform X2 [Mastomys coucha]
MLQSRLCLGRWRLLPTIRAGGRGSPRALPPTPQVLCMKLYGNPKYHQALHYGTEAPQDEITVHYRHGLPLVTVTLPSRKERCQFVVKPMLSTVGSFLQDLQNEDKGIKTAAIITADGGEIPASTLMDTLLMKDFKLVINKLPYDIRCHKKGQSWNSRSVGSQNQRSPMGRLSSALGAGRGTGLAYVVGVLLGYHGTSYVLPDVCEFHRLFCILHHNSAELHLPVPLEQAVSSALPQDIAAAEF